MLCPHDRVQAQLISPGMPIQTQECKLQTLGSTDPILSGYRSIASLEYQY